MRFLLINATRDKTTKAKRSRHPGKVSSHPVIGGERLRPGGIRRLVLADLNQELFADICVHVAIGNARLVQFSNPTVDADLEEVATAAGLKVVGIPAPKKKKAAPKKAAPTPPVVEPEPEPEAEPEPVVVEPEPEPEPEPEAEDSVADALDHLENDGPLDLEEVLDAGEDAEAPPPTKDQLLEYYSDTLKQMLVKLGSTPGGKNKSEMADEILVLLDEVDDPMYDDAVDFLSKSEKTK